MKRLVIGVLAHVDAGKTTLSEAMLFRAGETRRLGRVDHGDAFLDTHALERGRGITIFAKQAVLHLPDAQLTLLDTPGHVDFSPEAERTLQVLDAAVLVISGTDGVQSHTETLWRLLRRYRVPVFLFVNKMDLPGAERAALQQQLCQRLDAACVDMSADVPPLGRDEALAVCAESLMEQFLETGTLSQESLAAAVSARQVFPCFYGSALRLDGVDALLHGLAADTNPPQASAAFGAQVFKVAQDAQGARLTYLKITGGSLRVRAAVQGQSADGAPWEEKVSAIRIYSGAKFRTVDEALPGMVCAVTGLSKTAAGQGLGAQPGAAAPVLEPVLGYRVLLPEGTDVPTALAQLRCLEEEEPQLHVVWQEALGEIHVQLMGEVQLEVLQSLLNERFGLQVQFADGGIMYKETIAAPVEGVGHYEPLRHYAEVHLALEPGPRGSGLHFAAECPADTLDKNWQRLVLTHLAEKQHRGVLTGAPITDMTITLIAGRAHLKHTEGGDFRQATYRAVRHGLRRAESVLLEPWYTFRLSLPQENVGRAMSDLERRGASFAAPQTEGGTALLTGRAPVASLRGYAQELTGYTKGRGRLFCAPDGYAPCHNAAEVIAQAAYDPDADVENTADSVFCAHGAGYAVKWDKVTEQMHLDTGFGRQQAPQPEEPPERTRRRAASYCASLALDKELLAIFERTYGPVADRRAAFAAKPRAASAQSPKVQPLPEGPEYLLVDGYNIIYAWDELAALAKDNLAAARSRLSDILCNYQGFRQCEVILVFDAYKVQGGTGSVEKLHNISVVYTKEAETADMYIEKVTHTLGRQHRVRVATSDGMEQIIILGHGATRVSARAFRAEIEAADAAIRAFLTQR